MSLYSIVDLETTGFNKIQDRALSISALTFNQKLEVVNAQNYFICDCKRACPEDALAVHKLSNEFLSETGVPLVQAVDALYPLLQRSNFVAHSVDFDSVILQMEFERCGYNLMFNNKVCTMISTKSVCQLPHAKGGYKNPKLSEMCEHFGISAELTAARTKKYFGDIPTPDGAVFHLSAFDVTAVFCCLLGGGWPIVQRYYELN